MFGVDSHKIGAVPCGVSGGNQHADCGGGRGRKNHSKHTTNIFNVSMSKTCKRLLFVTSAVLTNYTSCVEGVFDFRTVIEGVENAGKALEKITKDAGEAVEKLVEEGGEAAKGATKLVEKVGKDLQPLPEKFARKVEECGEDVKKWCDETLAGELNLHAEFNCRAALRCLEVHFNLSREFLPGRGAGAASSSNSSSSGIVVLDESENMMTVSTPEDHAEIHVAAAPESETNPHENGGSTTGRDDIGVAGEVESGEVEPRRPSAPEVDDVTHHVHVIEDEERPDSTSRSGDRTFERDDTVDEVDSEVELHQVRAPGAGHHRGARYGPEFLRSGTARSEDDSDATPVAPQLAESETDEADQHDVGTQTETRPANEDVAVLTTRSPRSRNQRAMLDEDNLDHTPERDQEQPPRRAVEGHAEAPAAAECDSATTAAVLYTSGQHPGSTEVAHVAPTTDPVRGMSVFDTNRADRCIAGHVCRVDGDIEPGHVGRAASVVGNSGSAAVPEHSAHVDTQESAHSGFLAPRQGKKPKPDHLANALCFEDGRAVEAEAEGGEGGCSSSSSPAGVRVKEEPASSSSGPSEQDQSAPRNAGGAAEDHDSSDGVEVIVGEGGRGDGSYHSARGSEGGNGEADSGGSGSGTMDGDAEEEEEEGAEDAGVDDAGDAAEEDGAGEADDAEEDEYERTRCG